MELIINIVAGGIAVFVASYIVPGVEVDNFLVAIIVSIVLGILNSLLRPILVILTLPINILTLGLFTFVINVGMIFLTDYLVPGFGVDGLMPAVLFGLALSIVNYFLSSLKR